MKQPTFHGRVLLPLSVFADARAGDPLAMERILRYYDGYMNKLCTHLFRAAKDRYLCRSASFFWCMAASEYDLYLHSIIHISCLVFFGRMKYNKKCYRRYEHGWGLADLQGGSQACRYTI